MVDVHTRAKQDLGRLLIAALVLEPLGAGLTEDELRTAALQSGMAVPLFNEVISKFWEDHVVKHSDRMVKVSAMDLQVLGIQGNSYSFPPVFPMATLPRIQDAFTRLEQRHGVNSAKSIEMLALECQEPVDKVTLALGFLVTIKHVNRLPDGFVRRLPGGVSLGTNDPMHPQSKALDAAIAIVQSVLAGRSESATPHAKPVDRFHRFLVKQGWAGLAQWWISTAREAAGLWDYHPTAAGVLAGALLEASLVAIAEPAKQSGEWNHKFLKDEPKSWQLRDLIKQAEVAQTFSANEAAHARTLADIRNRIHAGRFATGGADPFRPPCTNAHEAQIARLHLDLLLTRILDWKPISLLQ